MFRIVLYFCIISPHARAPVNITGTNQKEKGGKEPAACPNKRVPIDEKREEAGVSTMHGAQANTSFNSHFGMYLVVYYFQVAMVAGTGQQGSR